MIVEWVNRMNIEILYEDIDIVAINKPAGLVVHSDGRSISLTTSKTKEPTLVDWILEKYPEAKDVGEPSHSQSGEIIYRPGIVHRLDRETSGVMLVAKTEKGFQHLKKQFQNHEIKKVYHAFIYGELKKNEDTIDRPIARSKKDFRLWSAQRGSRGELREAITEYKVVSTANGYSFVHVMPKTGRTHQIRVHFKAIHHPLVSDSLYAPKRENSLGFTRRALHSSEITFADINDNTHTVVAQEPEDFILARTLLQKV